MKKITKLSDLNQIDGKSERTDKAGNVIPTTLDQLLGTKMGIVNVYGTADLDEYKKNIEGLNLAELRNHAISLGRFVPNSNRDRLTKQLVNEFVKFKASYSKPAHVDSNVSLQNSVRGKKKFNEALKIMSAVK